MIVQTGFSTIRAFTPSATLHSVILNFGQTLS
jgi:hypothetical protein